MVSPCQTSSFLQVKFLKIAHTKGNVFLTAIVNLYKKIVIN